MARFEDWTSPSEGVGKGGPGQPGSIGSVVAPPIVIPDAKPRVASLFAKRDPAQMTLQALQQRQQNLAARGSGQMFPEVASWTQGLANALDMTATGFQEGRVDRQMAEGNRTVQDAIASADPVTGLVPMEAIAAIAPYDRDLAAKLLADRTSRQAVERWSQIPTPKGETGQWYQDQTGNTKRVGGTGDGADGGPKRTDIASMYDDYNNVPDVKKFGNAQSMWASISDAATRDTPQADLNMIVGTAKIFDPDSAVHQGESGAVELTGNVPQSLISEFMRLSGTPGARLSKTVRQGLVQEAYSRMQGYYGGVKDAEKYFTEKAVRGGYDARDVVRPMTMPEMMDLEKVVGQDVMDGSTTAQPDMNVPMTPEYKAAKPDTVDDATWQRQWEIILADPARRASWLTPQR